MCFLKFLAVIGAQAASMTTFGIKSPDEPGIIPILDVVVGAVMDLDLDRVCVIVDEKDDHRQLRRIICATSCAVN
jgi:hypothetical protein